MSLILEALRKSEAERQAAQLPGLIAPASQARTRDKRRARWLLLPLVLLIGLVLGGLAPRWWSAEVASPPGEDATRAGEETAVPALSAEQASGSAPASGSSPAQAPNTPAATTAIPAQAPAPAPQAAEINSLPPVGADKTPADIASSADPAQAPSRSAGPAAPPIPDAAPLASMPQGQRQQLPDLRLTVHVFNEDPGKRFALVDGRRVEQGASLSGGVTLREIRRDGLLLDINGQPWLLERPR